MSNTNVRPKGVAPSRPSATKPSAARGISEQAVVLAAMFAIGLVAMALLYRPWATPAIGYDSAASVLYFDRIAGRQPLEAFVGATPKPLMTLIYGLAFNVFHDWRLVSGVATLEYPAMLVAGAALGWRASGPVAAFVAFFGLLLSRPLLLDGALTYANPWAILLWALAGLALTAGKPRYAWAGVALLLATLMRIETLIVLALAAAALAAWRLLPARWIPSASRLPARPPARASLLLLGFLALPIMIIHDLALASNGFFWLDVSSIVSRTDPTLVETPAQVGGDLIRHFAAMWPFLGLAIVGVADLVRRRSVVVLLGLIALVPGVVALIELLALKSTYVSYRYTIPADAALTFAAAIGVGAVTRVALDASRRLDVPRVVARLATAERSRVRLGLAAAGLVIGALVFVSPIGPVARGAGPTINDYRSLQSNYERLQPAIAAGLKALPDQPAWGIANLEDPKSNPPPRLYAPTLLMPRLAVDLAVPVWAVGAGSPLTAVTDPASLRVSSTCLVYIDASQGGDALAADQPLEVDRPVRVGHVDVEPLAAYPADGLWLVRLSPAGD